MIGTACVNSIERDPRSWADVAKLEIETQKNEPRNLWVRCGYVSRALCKDWEVHPRGRLRWWESKVAIPGTADIGGYLVTFRTIGPKKFKRNKTISLHRISLETFFPKPHRTLECDHRDENRENFDIRNLRWVSHSLNVAFQKHRGWGRMWVKKEQRWKYRARFRDHSYPYRDTKEQARREYLYVRAVWIREERERIIQLVMAHNGVDRLEAIRMLNWDKRDDVFFLVELNE
jgi:hypothetical protein